MRGAREHNPKDASLEIPPDALFVFTGVSGSGKSSLAFGFVMVELLFMPNVYSPCPICHGTRFNAKTLEIR